MRVALPLGGTDWGRSGIGHYVQAIIPHLRTALADRMAELLVFGNRRELDAYSPYLEGIPTAVTPAWADAPAQSASWYLTYAGRFAQSRGAHVTLYPAAQRRCCIYQPIPSVAVVHDLGQLKVSDKYDPLRMFYFKQIALRLIGRADCKVAISRSTRDDLAEALKLRAEDIRVIPNGVDYSRFVSLTGNAPAEQAMRAATGLEGPYLLYPARLEHPAKNHVRLLEAFAKSALRQTHVLALSGGDFGGKEVISAAIERLGLTPRVRLLGYVTEEHLPALVAAAEVVIMVGLTEGFGLPVLEALACSRPVCVAQAGALPEVAGTLGAMCDPFDPASIQLALERAALDEPYRARCREEGPAWARRWGWDQTGQGLAEACLAVARA